MNKIYTLFAFALFTISISVQPMDKLKKKNTKKQSPTAFVLENWAIEAGTILLGSLNLKRDIERISQDKNFLKLPDVDRAIIIKSLYGSATAKTLDTAALTIRNLTHSNIQLDKLINDPGFSLSLVKHYSKEFNTNNESVSKILNTKEALKRLGLQEYFLLRICQSHHFEPGILKEFRESNFDLNFTDQRGYTPAEQCILLGNIEGLKVFLDRGVDPDPLLELAATLTQDTKMKLMIKFLQMEQEKRMKKRPL